jgi:hypothetical protein
MLYYNSNNVHTLLVRSLYALVQVVIDSCSCSLQVSENKLHYWGRAKGQTGTYEEELFLDNITRFVQLDELDDSLLNRKNTSYWNVRQTDVDHRHKTGGSSRLSDQTISFIYKRATSANTTNTTTQTNTFIH